MVQSVSSSDGLSIITSTIYITPFVDSTYVPLKFGAARCRVALTIQRGGHKRLDDARDRVWPAFSPKTEAMT